MKRILLGAVLLVALQASAAGLTGSAAAEKMRQARFSAGFEARMNVLVTLPNGAHPAPLKLSIIGQMSQERQRVLVRAISPAAVKDHYVVAERVTGRPMQAWAYDVKLALMAIAPTDGLFGTGLVTWDLFTPWWSWRRQELLGAGKVNGHDCEQIRSLADEPDSRVQSVESCINSTTGVSYRTRLYDGQHALLRETRVEALVRKENGGQAAKKSRIKDGSGKTTDIEVYAGDEEYQVTAETFAVLDRLSADK